MTTTLIVASTQQRAQHLRTVLSGLLKDHTIRVISTDGPCMQGAPKQLGVDADLRPQWMRSLSGSAKLLAAAAVGVDEVVVFHEPTLLATGDAHLVRLVVGPKTPVRLLAVSSFEAPVLINAWAGKVVDTTFNQDAYDAHAAVDRILHHGTTTAVNQVLGTSFDIPDGLPALLALSATTTTRPPSWYVEAKGAGFTACSDSCTTREAADTIVEQLHSGIAVTTLDETRELPAPSLHGDAALLLQLTRKFNFSAAYAQQLLGRLLDLGFLGRIHQAGDPVPTRVSDTARMVIEDTCGADYVGHRVVLYPAGTWYATDPGVRPSKAELTKDLRAVYGLVWALTVGAHSVPMKVRSRTVRYRKRGTEQTLLLAGGDSIVSPGYRRAVAGILDVPVADQIGDDVAVRDIHVVESAATTTRGCAVADLGIMFRDGQALSYALKEELVVRDGLHYVTTPKGDWLLSFLTHLDVQDTAGAPMEAARLVQGGLAYKDAVQPYVDRMAAVQASSSAMVAPSKCPTCKKKVQIKVSKLGVVAKCASCKKTMVVTITEKGLGL